MSIGIQGEMEDALQRFSTPFEAVKYAEQNVQFSLDPAYGLTPRRYQWYSNGTLFDTTNLADVESGIRISTSATGTDTARLKSNIAGQYVAQALAQPGVGMVIDDGNVAVDANGRSSLSHGEVYVGAFWWDSNNDQIDTGVAYKWDSTGWSFILKSDGDHIGDSPVSQGDFSEDTADGSGDIGRIIDPSNGYVYNWPYTWYNEGPFLGSVFDPVSNRVEHLHQEAVTGRPTTDVPNFPTQVVVRNDGTASSLGVEIGGMQYSTYGAGIEQIEFRETDIPVTTEGDSFISPAKVVTDNVVDAVSEPGVPLLSFRRDNTNVQGMAVNIQSYEVRPISDDIYVFEWDEYDPGSGLTGASFGAVDTQESNIEIDTVATDYSPSSNSVLRSIKFFEGGSKNQTGQEVRAQADTRIATDATRVITAVNDGDATADVDPILVKIEEAY